MNEGGMRGNGETIAAPGLGTYVNGHNSGDQNEDLVGKSVAAGARVRRRRTSKACDHCNSSRRKCDGHLPCGYCVRKLIFYFHAVLVLLQSVQFGHTCIHLEPLWHSS
jgi:hypothetical protein